MWERSFLFSVACDYSLDPDHGWIHGPDVVAQTKLAPRSVPEIAKRFPELVERRRHQRQLFRLSVHVTSLGSSNQVDRPKVD
jgi:hypothetical protein